LLGSVCVFTHAVPQKVRLSFGHDSVHAPLMQAAPCGQPPHASVCEDLCDEHPGMGMSATAVTAIAASRIDDRTRLLVWFAMTSCRPQQAGCLSNSSGRRSPQRMTRAPWRHHPLLTHGFAHSANAPQLGSAAHAVTIGLSHGAAPPSAGPRTSFPMHMLHASPGMGLMGDCAHADDAHA
jgi:hypothetical protein